MSDRDSMMTNSAFGTAPVGVEAGMAGVQVERLEADMTGRYARYVSRWRRYGA